MTVDPVEVAQEQRIYVVVLRARSAARFMPEDGHEFFFSSVPGCEGTVRFRARTRWVDEGYEAPLPRELWIEGRGPAPSLDHAVSKFTAVARSLTALIAFTANTQAGIPEPHVAYDATDGAKRRDFLEVFVPDERGHPAEGRLVRVSELTAVFTGLDAAREAPRVARAIDHYGLALRYWYFGGEWLALTHLYMAVETLTKASIRHRCNDEQVDERTLAEGLKINTTDEKWEHELEVWARREVIFQGDVGTYRKARKASDGVEHGFLELEKVHRHALDVTETTFAYVRETILRLLNVDRSQYSELYQRPPRDVQSLRRMIRGHFIGDGTDPAPATEEYPYLEWNSSVKMWRREGDQFSSSFKDNFTVRCSPSYKFNGSALEVRGRTEPGSPLRLEASVEVEETAPALPGATALSIMRRAKAFADEVAGQGTTREIPAFLGTVFGLAAVHMSLFEAIEVLVKDSRPAEAILLLGNLVQGACRLEAIADHENPVGVAVRIRLDALNRQASLYETDGSVSGLIRERAAEYRSAAESQDITIPEAPDITKTTFYAESKGSLGFAEEVAKGDEAAIALHTIPGSDGTHGLHTRLPDQQMALGIASDAASALLASAVSLATVMAWPFDADLLSSLKAEIGQLEAET